MKEKDFKDLLKSIDRTREIHASKRKPSRVFKANKKLTKIYREIMETDKELLENFKDSYKNIPKNAKRKR